MTIREKVARAICECEGGKCTNCDGAIQHFKGLLPSGKLHEQDRPCPYSKDAAAAIATFLEAAGEDGWHMRPDEATVKMRVAASESGPPKDGSRAQGTYHAMQAVAPKFKWDQ